MYELSSAVYYFAERIASEPFARVSVSLASGQLSGGVARAITANQAVGPSLGMLAARPPSSSTARFPAPATLLRPLNES